MKTRPLSLKLIAKCEGSVFGRLRARRGRRVEAVLALRGDGRARAAARARDAAAQPHPRAAVLAVPADAVPARARDGGRRRGGAAPRGLLRGRRADRGRRGARPPPGEAATPGSRSCWRARSPLPKKGPSPGRGAPSYVAEPVTPHTAVSMTIVRCRQPGPSMSGPRLDTTKNLSDS